MRDEEVMASGAAGLGAGYAAHEGLKSLYDKARKDVVDKANKIWDEHRATHRKLTDIALAKGTPVGPNPSGVGRHVRGGKTDADAMKILNNMTAEKFKLLNGAKKTKVVKFLTEHPHTIKGLGTLAGLATAAGALKHFSDRNKDGEISIDDIRKARME